MIESNMQGEKIKILHLTQNLGMGGKELVIQDLVTRSNSKFESIICVLKYQGFLAEQIRSKGIDVIFINVKKESNKIKTIKQISDILRTYQINILVCHDFMSCFYGIPAAKLSGVNSIFHVRHSFLENENNKTLILSRLLSFFTDVYIAVSDEIKIAMIHKEKIRPDKIDVIYNGIDFIKYQVNINKINILKSMNLDENTFVIGTVTRFFKVKNIEMQIELIDQLRKIIPNIVHLIVAPIDKYGEDIQNIILSKNLTNHVKLLGFRTDIPELLKIIDVFILTSLSEGTSIALLEAMAAGCAVVVSNVGGNIRLIKHMENGILFPFNSIDQLQNYIIKLYTSPDLRKKLGLEAQKTSQEYGVDKMVQNYENFFLKSFSEY